MGHHTVTDDGIERKTLLMKQSVLNYWNRM